VYTSVTHRVHIRTAPRACGRARGPGAPGDDLATADGTDALPGRSRDAGGRGVIGLVAVP